MPTRLGRPAASAERSADLGAIGGVGDPALALGDPFVSRRNDSHRRLVDGTRRMKMVADRAARALRQHGAALIDHGVRLLVAADLAPMEMELAAHAEEGHAERIGIAGRKRKWS